LSVMALTMTMRRLGAGSFTVHGFRSAFRDWAGDETQFPREVAEAALAHAVGDECEFRGNPAGDSDLMSATVPI
jgi:integrase